MGRTRADAGDQAQQTQQAPDYRKVALALAGGAGAGVGAGALAGVVAALVGLGIPESEARRVASLVVADVPVVDGTTGILRASRVEQVIYRAVFAIQSGRRLVVAREGAGAEGVLKQLERERGYYQLHLNANARRENGAAQTIRAVERWGELLSWNATIRPSNRPNHRAAHRKNWRPLDGIPILTGALPATLPFCLCFPGPPIAGAEVLAA